MKNIWFVISLLGFLIGCSTDGDSEVEDSMVKEKPEEVARTAIPDIEFERILIELKYDDIEDGFVDTDNINDVPSLVISDKNITDLTGIEDFSLLDNLWVNNNNLTSLDVSRNTRLKFIFVQNNNLSTLKIPRTSTVEKIGAENNKIADLDVSSNTGLQFLNLSNNLLTKIDVSNIVSAIQLNVFAIENNPLSCIKVNSRQLNSIPSQWTKDETDVYSVSCN